MPTPHLDQATLRSMLHYDPETGVFTWLPRRDRMGRRNTRFAGKVAGNTYRPPKAKSEYVSICVLNWPFAAHRLAFLYMTGEWPLGQADHEDLNGLNNRWSNLRDATKAQNMSNTSAPKTNRTGFKGVCFDNGKSRFLAQIRHNGKSIFIGRYRTAEEAHAAYCQKATELRGEFARTA